MTNETKSLLALLSLIGSVMFATVKVAHHYTMIEQKLAYLESKVEILENRSNSLVDRPKLERLFEDVATMKEFEQLYHALDKRVLLIEHCKNDKIQK